VNLVKFCPECGGDLKMDTSTKNFTCKSCGLYASRDKMEELKDKSEISSSDSKQRTRDDYLDWWQSSKKEKQRN
jgi:DNA-directed RNA polymerase subunit M/transcription elongation factor TFIIS